MKLKPVLTLFLLMGMLSANAQVTPAEKQALQDLYNSTNGPNWATETDGFLGDEWDFNGIVTSDWYGVTVANGHVTELDLEFNELTGNIPASIGDLVHLINLNLRLNYLTGSIPNEIGNLSELQSLDISWNSLNGPIPPELGSLSLLNTLRLSSNDLTGLLPSELGDLVNLTTLNLVGNQLVGSIPQEVLSNLINLNHLILYGNDLSGPIPPEIQNLTNLVTLSLHSNEFNGAIPPELGNLQALTTLKLGSNNLSGNIPSELGNLSNLEELSLGNNTLTGNIPSELGNLSNLSWIRLNSNQLSGPIPSEFGNLSLLYLDLYDNVISGQIPSELANSTNIFWLSLQSNELSGPIPPELGNLTNLYQLNLYENQLTGSIPPELGNIIDLEFLWLYNNLLSGEIPSQLSNLSNLESIKLNNNDLSGPIPPELGDLTNLSHIDLSDNQLNGSIPPELGNLGNLISVNLDNNALSGNIPLELGNLNNLKTLGLANNNLNGNVPPQIIDQTPIIFLFVENNIFDFGNLEYTYQNWDGNTFTYSPQQKTDQPEAFQIDEGTNITLNTQISGTQNHYQWYKDGQPINGAPDSPDYEIVNATAQDAGTYHCVMTSDIVINLVLTRHNIDLSVDIPEPGEQPEEENWNIITVWDYDMDTNLKGNIRRYYDCLGKHVQTQSWDPVTHAVWGQATLYDFQGRPALSTLSAPIPGKSQFLYHPSLMTNEGGQTYSAPDFEADPFAPDTVTDDSPVGQYYSGVTSHQYQDITPYPFSRTIFSDLNPGSPLAVVGGNKADIDGDQSMTLADTWPQAYTFTMPATNELSLSEASGDAKYQNIKTLKTVTRDVHGNETVVFMDTDGKLLAAARSGEEGATSLQMSLPIGKQGSVDVHIPKGITGISISNENAVTLYNLITDAVEPTLAANLPPGFYRIAVNDLDNYDPNTITVNYRINYYNYSLNEYDEAGRLVASYQPIEDVNGNRLVTIYEYNTLGQLVSTISPDEGTANFLYQNDGQIRYSQNSKQELVNEVSYTDYDRFGRPVESGVLIDVDFASLDPDQPLPMVDKKEVNTTGYDFLLPEEEAFLTNQNPGHLHPTFLAGNVTKTANEHTTTYYSYDGYGRVNWLVHYIDGLGTKTIDYTYEPLTGLVEKVIYQKEEQDQLVHRYTYNDRNQLKQMETSVDGDSFTLQAEYFYNEAGTLVRTEIADGAQGLDYVYGLNGQLKSINHPSLDPVQDPGGDQNDLFGMQLDYHFGDYSRTENTNITTAPQGTDQYNGNIKGIRWQTRVNGLLQSQYTYSYDRNNWLTGADFNPGEKNDGAYDVSGITYDANGNIQNLHRRKGKGSGKTHMDDLTYNYDPKRPNRLTHVNDEVGYVPDADDIVDQKDDNYKYNAIGQLVRDTWEDIDYIYNTSGLVTEVWRSGEPLVKFFYNDRNQRVKKEHYAENNFLFATTYYVRDVAGQVMAVYNDASGILNLVEQPMYGAGRIGIVYNGANDIKTYVYELTDHLGNVRAVFIKDGNNVSLEGYTDYYPGGMVMPGRNSVDVNGYRYGYQGQFAETDPETGKPAFELRLYDPRINRWLSPDPARQYASPYLSMGNNWINKVDPDGGEDWYIDENGNRVYDSRVHSQADLADLGIEGSYIGETFYDLDTGDMGFSNGIFRNFRTGEHYSFLDEVVVGPSATPVWLNIASREIGQTEIAGSNHNPRIIEYLQTTGDWWNTDETPWCSGFCNWTIQQAGIQGTNSARALSWRNWQEGFELDEPALGAIATKTRRGGGHVGFVAGVNSNGQLIILGGNQSNSVRYSAYSSNFKFHYPNGYVPDYDLPILEVNNGVVTEN